MAGEAPPKRRWSRICRSSIRTIISGTQPHRGHYLLPELLADIGGGHNIVSTVFLECRAMYRKDGPREMAPSARSSSSTASRR